MPRSRVKICGITRLEDALAAADCGADAVGMILHASAPRKISIELAQQIVNALPPSIARVGVFVDAPSDFIRSAATTLHLQHVQLHGNESLSQVRELADLSVIKAIHPRDRSIEAALKAWEPIASALHGVLIETGRGAHAGGNGIASDWDTIAKLDRKNGLLARVHLIAAGGLSPENVEGVIFRLRPWAVDVSSGVEQSIGIKSFEKVHAFCAAVRSADILA